MGVCACLFEWVCEIVCVCECVCACLWECVFVCEYVECVCGLYVVVCMCVRREAAICQSELRVSLSPSL